MSFELNDLSLIATFLGRATLAWRGRVGLVPLDCRVWTMGSAHVVHAWMNAGQLATLQEKGKAWRLAPSVFKLLV